MVVGASTGIAIAAGRSNHPSPARAARVANNGPVTHIAQHDGTDFATSPSPEAAGKSCYLATIKRLGANAPAVTACSDATASFPSAVAPVLDMSVFTSPATDENEVHAVQIQGFVTNVVKRVVVTTATGRNYIAPVQNSTYATGRVPASESVVSISAFGARGGLVYSKSLVP
jgi:hypothetical protein